MAGYSTVPVGTSGTLSPGYGAVPSGPYVFSTNNTTNTSPWIIANNGSTGSTPSIHVTGDAEFEGNVTVKGRNLVKLLETIEDRLAIISNPDPKKLEKFKALKKAYDHYKLMEKLIGEEE
jgi:hypothetical protein